MLLCRMEPCPLVNLLTRQLSLITHPKGTNPITKNMPRALPWAINIKFVSLQSALFVFKQSLSVLVVAVGG